MIYNHIMKTFSVKNLKKYLHHEGTAKINSKIIRYSSKKQVDISQI